MLLRPTMCPQAQSDSSGSNQIIKRNEYQSLPPQGSKQRSPGRILGRWWAQALRRRAAQQQKEAKKAARRSSIHRVYEQHGALWREQVKGRGSNTCPNQERGSRDGSADPGSRLWVVCQGDCGSAGFWERTEQLIYVCGKEGRRTAAVVVSYCRLECTNTRFMTLSSLFVFAFLSVSPYR